MGLLSGAAHASGRAEPDDPARDFGTRDPDAVPGVAARPPSAFAVAVLEVVAGVAPGDVVTYAEVAAEAGRPRAARAVGTVLRRFGSSVPWWRVVTADGRLVPGLEPEHTRRLAEEGVTTERGRVRAAG